MDTPESLIAALGGDSGSSRPAGSVTNGQTGASVPGTPTPSTAGSKKLAAFRLQTLISDPAFADQFVSLGGLDQLREVALTGTGNTLAYGFGALARLVELDVGVDPKKVGPDVVERAVGVVAEERLVNILRSGMSLLVALVGTGTKYTPVDSGEPGVESTGRPAGRSSSSGLGFVMVHAAAQRRASFFNSLAGHLGSADHGLATGALQLINGLVRGALAASPGSEKLAKPDGGMGSESADWAGLIKQLQDVGVIGAVYGLSHENRTGGAGGSGSGIAASAPADSDLGAGLAEFESLTRRMLARWRSVRVDERVTEHARALAVVYMGALNRGESAMNGPAATGPATGYATPASERAAPNGMSATAAGWRRIGFLSGAAASECGAHPAGLLGLMDLSDYVRRQADSFSRLLAEQAFEPEHHRCPIGRASLAVTEALFDHFVPTVRPDGTVDGGESGLVDGVSALEVTGEQDDVGPSVRAEQAKAAKQPYRLVMHWSRLHTAALHAFLRLWRDAGGEVGIGAEENGDVERVAGLVRVLVSDTLTGQTEKKRTSGSTSSCGPPTDVSAVESIFGSTSLAKLRARQAELLDSQMAVRWAARLAPVRRELEQEALQFVREQRIRCLLAGGWFAVPDRTSGNTRYARLASNRRYLHWTDLPSGSSDVSSGRALPVTSLGNVLDLGLVAAVVSNTCATESGMKTVIYIKGASEDGDGRRPSIGNASTTTTTTTTTSTSATTTAPADALLELHPPTPAAASEWLDGLLMLLHQQPITAATANLVSLLVNTGLRVRLLNVPVGPEGDGISDREDEDEDEDVYDLPFDPTFDPDGTRLVRVDESEMSGRTVSSGIDSVERRPLRAHPIGSSGMNGRRRTAGSMRTRPGGVGKDVVPLGRLSEDGDDGLLPVVWPDRIGTEDPYWYAIGGS